MAIKLLIAKFFLVCLVPIGGVLTATSQAPPAASSVYVKYCGHLLLGVLNNSVACLVESSPASASAGQHRNRGVAPLSPCVVVKRAFLRLHDRNGGALEGLRDEDRADGLFALASLTRDGTLHLWDVAARPSGRRAAACNATCYGLVNFAGAGGHLRQRGVAMPTARRTRPHVAAERSSSDRAVLLLTITACYAGRPPRHQPKEPRYWTRVGRISATASGPLGRHAASRSRVLTSDGDRVPYPTLASSAAGVGGDFYGRRARRSGDADAPAAAKAMKDSEQPQHEVAEKNETLSETTHWNDFTTRGQLSPASPVAIGSALTTAADDGAALTRQDFATSATTDSFMTVAANGTTGVDGAAASHTVSEGDNPEDVTANIATSTAEPGTTAADMQGSATGNTTTDHRSADLTERTSGASEQAGTTAAYSRSVASLEWSAATARPATGDPTVSLAVEAAISSAATAAAAENGRSSAGYNSATPQPLTAGSSEARTATGDASAPTSASATAAADGRRSTPPSTTAVELGKAERENHTHSGTVGDLNGGTVAVEVIVPTVVLLGAGIGVYIWYRKKYPVRMTIGRKFVKHSNPEYKVPPVPMVTLVKDEV